MKLQYGNTWWGSEWLKALEEADHANRLPRGRVYVRGGAVISMHWEGETLTAKVQGTRRTPYHVTLTLPPSPQNKVQAFLDDVSRHPSIVTKLLHRELAPAVMRLAERESGESTDSFRAGGGRISAHSPPSPPYPGGRSRSTGPAPPA